MKGISEQADKVNKLGESQRERDRIPTRQNPDATESRRDRTREYK
jgi:hypothetical protein